MKSYVLTMLVAGWAAAGMGQARAQDTGPSAPRLPASSLTGAPRSVPSTGGPRLSGTPRAASPAATAASRAPAPAPDAGASTSRVPPMDSGSTAGSAVYLIGPQDVVEVRVFQEDDLLTTARVAQDGTIKFPLIGSVKVGGRTEDSAAQIIGAGLAKDYIVNPQVSVKVVEYAQRRYTVLGQVGKPGTYTLPDRESIFLLEAIGNAGGFTRIADQSKITIKRLVGGKETSYRLTAKEGAANRETSSFEIKPGDIITVAETFF